MLNEAIMFPTIFNLYFDICYKKIRFDLLLFIEMAFQFEVWGNFGIPKLIYVNKQIRQYKIEKETICRYDLK